MVGVAEVVEEGAVVGPFVVVILDEAVTFAVVVTAVGEE